MTQPRRGRLLLVSPSFHSYWRPIQDAFAQLGWEVETHRYDASDTVADKLRVKLSRELPAQVGASPEAVDTTADRRARVAVHTFRPDRVLVIKGDTLGPGFADALDRPRVPRTLWLYDELRRTRHTTESLARYDSIASYSHLDVAELARRGLTSTFVPLAFASATTVRPRQTNDVVFVGARYDKRQRLISALHRAGVPVKAFGRDWSSHSFDRLRTWRLSGHSFPTGRDLSLTEAYAVMAGAPAALNIHGDQDGFTMRTFEVCGIGGVQLIDRADVTEFYEPGREVLAFSSEDELLELAWRCLRDDAFGDRLREAGRRRTLAEHTMLHRARALEASWV